MIRTDLTVSRTELGKSLRSLEMVDDQSGQGLLNDSAVSRLACVPRTAVDTITYFQLLCPIRIIQQII